EGFLPRRDGPRERPLDRADRSDLLQLRSEGRTIVVVRAKPVRDLRRQHRTAPAPQLTRRVPAATVEAPVEHHPGCNPAADADAQEIADAQSLPEPQLRERHRADGVFD